jgi:hypothetical protein
LGKILRDRCALQIPIHYSTPQAHSAPADLIQVHIMLFARRAQGTRQRIASLFGLIDGATHDLSFLPPDVHIPLSSFHILHFSSL